MFIIIPGPLIALATFPGVILHEMAHRFFCDRANVTVHAVNYFNFGSKTSGYVIYKSTDNLKHVFFIGIAPLIINSLACMLLTFTFATKLYLNSPYDSIPSPLQFLMAWFGYSAGFNAIPSNKDVSRFVGLAKSRLVKIPLYIFVKIIAFFNIEGAGPFICFVYAVGISLILPALAWRLYL